MMNGDDVQRWAATQAQFDLVTSVELLFGGEEPGRTWGQDRRCGIWTEDGDFVIGERSAGCNLIDALFDDEPEGIGWESGLCVVSEVRCVKSDGCAWCVAGVSGVPR